MKMKWVCMTFGWFFLSFLLLSGGAMSFLIMSGNEFWDPTRSHLIPLGHAHAGLLAIIMLIIGLYYDHLGWSEKVRKWIVIVYIAGTLILPGGFVGPALQPGAESMKSFILVPIGGVLVVTAWVAMFIGMWKTRRAHT